MTDTATEQSGPADATHEHGWIADSSHHTSEGCVVYVRCVRCGVRRVDIQPHPLLPPRALTREVGGSGTSRRPRSTPVPSSRA